MNEHILITGASSGIGRELALALAKQGKIVHAVARNEANLLLLKKQYISGYIVLGFKMDLLDALLLIR